MGRWMLAAGSIAAAVAVTGAHTSIGDIADTVKTDFDDQHADEFVDDRGGPSEWRRRMWPGEAWSCCDPLRTPRRGRHGTTTGNEVSAGQRRRCEGAATAAQLYDPGEPHSNAGLPGADAAAVSGDLPSDPNGTNWMTEGGAPGIATMQLHPVPESPSRARLGTLAAVDVCPRAPPDVRIVHDAWYPLLRAVCDHVRTLDGGRAERQRRHLVLAQRLPLS